MIQFPSIWQLQYQLCNEQGEPFGQIYNERLSGDHSTEFSALGKLLQHMSLEKIERRPCPYPGLTCFWVEAREYAAICYLRQTPAYDSQDQELKQTVEQQEAA